MRWLVNLALIAVICYAAVLVLLFVFQRSLLYVPDRSRPRLGSLADVGVREITLSTPDGLALLAWYLPPRDSDRPVIAYFHGNGGNIGYRADRLRRFAEQGYGVLMPEYRGYGGNPGSPTETGLVTDATAGLAFLEEQGISGKRLVLYGESLGSGIAVQLAATRPVGAVILESPYTSVAALAQYHYPYVPASWLILDRFDSLAAVGRVTAPILVLAGGLDSIIPPAFTRSLYDAAPQPKQMFFVPDGGHVNLDRFGGLEAVLAFVEARPK